MNGFVHERFMPDGLCPRRALFVKAQGFGHGVCPGEAILSLRVLSLKGYACDQGSRHYV